MKDANVSKIFDAMQNAFAPQIRDAMRDNWENYWRSQDKILDSMEEFAQGWFERRREATRTALEAACTMCDAKSPVDMVQSCQTWMTGSMERVAADGLGCQKHFMTIAELMAAPLSIGGEAREAEAKRTPANASEVETRAIAA